MKNRWKNTAFFAQVMVLCLCLAACGNSDDVAGDDWRTTGMVVDSGTITHDGDSVDVLVTVSESSAAFYRDLPEQVLFDSVSFPMNIPDAEQAFNAIFLEDLDGDGESDVLVSFIHENGDETELVWIWDPVERYVFREDLSTVAISGGADDGALLPADEIQSGEPYFTQNGLALGYFTRLFTTAEVGVSKHEPTIYLLAAEALHAAPAETLVFEDSLYALKTAKAAGFYTIGVYDADGETDQAGLQMAADLYVRDLHEAVLL